MANSIRDILNAHASVGYSQIEARVRDLNSIYLAARDRLESRIFTYVREKRASFTGPRLAMLMKELQKEYAGFEQAYSKKLKYSLNYVANGYYRDAMLHLGLVGNDTIAGGLYKDRIKLMMDDAYSHVAGATKNMSDYSIAQLRRISAQVMREAALTGETRVQVSRRLLAANTSGGWFQFIDRANKKWDNKTYFDMLGRTLLHNNARESYLQACADEGSDIVMVSTSGDPCPACAALEGRLLSISGKTAGLMTVAEATDAKLFHPNCTHRLVAVPESVAEAYFDSKGKRKPEAETPEPQSGFVPAKTASEARAYTGKLANNVNLSKISNVDSLNAFNETVETLQKKYAVAPLKSIGQFNSDRTLMKANVERIDVGIGFMKNPGPEYANAVSKYREDFLAQANALKKAIKEAPKTYANYGPEVINGSVIPQLQKRLQEAEEALKYSRANVVYKGMEVKTTATHEFGHVLADQIFGQINGPRVVTSNLSLAEQKRRIKMIQSAFREAKKSGDIYKISRYARENAKEFFAESFSMMEMGIEKLPEKVYTVLQEVLKDAIRS